MSTLIHTLIIPFSGFYNSMHSMVIDDAVCTMLDDQDDDSFDLDCETPIHTTPTTLITQGLESLTILSHKDANEVLEAELGGDKGIIDKHIRTIPIQDYDVPSNKRSRQLSAHIEYSGCIEPLIVSYDRYERVYIVEGHDRAAALQQLGYDRAPVIVIHRKDLNNTDHDTQKFLSYEAMQSVFTTYASTYASSFLEHCDLPTEYKDAIQFEKLDSPKEYNFTTDRIFCTVTPAFLEYMSKTVRDNDLDSYAREAYTDRDGFISFYHSDFREWGQLNTWDHNQISTLFECWAITCSDIPLDDDGTINEWTIAQDIQDNLYSGIQDANNLYPNPGNNTTTED